MNYTDHELLVLFIIGIGVVLAALTFLIVVNKAWRETREAFDRRRRAVLEPDVFRYVGATDTRTIRDCLPLPASDHDLALVEGILLDMATLVKGDSRDRITAACEQLGRVSRAIEALQSRRWWRRAEAAERLGTMRSRQAVDPLVNAMNDSMSEVRIRAARALGIIRGSTSIRPLVQALGDPSRWSAIRVAEILIGVGEEAVNELLQAYDSLPQHARISVLDVLGRIRSPRAAALLKRAIKDPSPDIRSRAAHAMGLIADPAFTDDLIQALKGPEWSVRAMAAKALGRIGAQQAIPHLASLVSDREWWVRSNAGDALRGLGDPGRQALVAMLDAPDVYARHQAVAQLEEGGIIDEYIADLGSPDDARREAAVEFIRKVIAGQRTDRLSQQAVEHTQDSVRKALLGILKRSPEGAS